MGAPEWAFGIQVGARDDELLDDLVMVVERRPHHGGVPKPAPGGATAAGVIPDQRIPLALGTHSNPPQSSG